MIEGKIPEESKEKLFKGIEKHEKELEKKLRVFVSIQTRKWQSHIREKYFTGFKYGKRAPNRLQVRSNFLRSSIKPKKTIKEGDSIRSGINFGAKYAPIHVGPKGQKTNFFNVWVPLQDAMTKAGVLRASMQDKTFWGDTFVQRTKRGNIVFFGKRVVQRGALAGETKGKILPLFVFKKNITVKTRIYPESILAWAKTRFEEDAISERLF